MNSGELSRSFNSEPPGSEPPKEAPLTPVSLKQIRDLEKQLSEPTIVYEWTPMGTVTREIRTENDARIMREIKRHREQLAKRRNDARDGFNRAHDGPGGSHLDERRRGRRM